MEILYFHDAKIPPHGNWAPSRIQTNSLEAQVSNLDGENNYTILETIGTGTYIGCNHSVIYLQGAWWENATT